MKEDYPNGVFALVPIERVSAAPDVSKEISGGDVIAANAVTSTVNDKQLVALQAYSHRTWRGKTTACISDFSL